MIDNIQSLTTGQLLLAYVDVEGEFMHRRFMEKHGGVVGAYGEALVCECLKLCHTGHNEKGHDAIDPSNGKTYQIKALRPSKSATLLGVVHITEKNPFDYYVGVIFYPHFEVKRVVKIPFDVLVALPEWKKKKNTENQFQLSLTQGLTRRSGVKNLYRRFSDYQREETPELFLPR